MSGAPSSARSQCFQSPRRPCRPPPHTPEGSEGKHSPGGFFGVLGLSLSFLKISTGTNFDYALAKLAKTQHVYRATPVCACVCGSPGRR